MKIIDSVVCIFNLFSIVSTIWTFYVRDKQYIVIFLKQDIWKNKKRSIFRAESFSIKSTELGHSIRENRKQFWKCEVFLVIKKFTMHLQHLN